jgi:uracil-DNA glycosylase family 4
VSEPITLPERPTIPKLQRAAAGCQACGLYRNATQTVFGDGPHSASVMLVGEQPGDREDIEGEPFVGPAGRLLDKALAEAGISRRDVYVTNVVKHFKWKPQGEAPPPPEAERRGDRRLPAVARW